MLQNIKFEIRYLFLIFFSVSIAGVSLAQIQSSSSSVSPILRSAKDHAEADWAVLDQALHVELSKGNAIDVCKVSHIKMEHDYDEWFIKNYSKFEELASNLEVIIAAANEKISILNHQSIRVNAVRGQKAPEVDLSLEQIISYFNFFNDQQQGCSSDFKKCLHGQLENPKSNPAHLALSQVLLALQRMTDRLNTSLKVQSASYELIPEVSHYRYGLALKVKLSSNALQQEYEFPLVNVSEKISRETQKGSFIAQIDLREETKWRVLGKSRIDGQPIDALLRYQSFQEGKTGGCDQFEIPTARSNLPWISYADLLTLGKKVKNENEFYSDSKMEFVAIKPQAFLMGSPETELNRMKDEDQHWVNLTQPFEIQTTPVTQKQWFEVMGNNPSQFKDLASCFETHTDEGGGMCPNNPVEKVSYDDITAADGFLAKMNAKNDGYLYRLPTEAEWEYSAKVGTTTAYFFGSEASELSAYAWYDQNAGGHTHAVGLKEKNGFELYDMLGNVFQWVQDWYGFYSGAGNKDPLGRSGGVLRVFRGGSWKSSEKDLRASYRDYWYPNSRYPHVGLRLARTRL